MTREICCLKDYISKLEFKINTQEKQILDLKTRSLENNIIINGINKKCTEKSDELGISKTVINLIIHDLNPKTKLLPNFRSQVHSEWEGFIQTENTQGLCVYS